MIEAEERGWEAPDKFVCADCVEDDYLKNVIDANASAHICNYCERQSESVIAAPVDPDGHFKFLHLWPGQNPPLDSVVIA
jgi:hypothetical protein